MLSTNRLVAIKGRMLLAAETAHRVANGQGEPIELADGEYQTVMASMLSLRDDVREVLAEIDILRGMVTGNYDHLFVKEDSNDNDEGSGTVGATGDEASERGGEGEPPDDSGSGGNVRLRGTDGEEESRPKPSRNKTPSRRRKKKVDAGD